MVWGTLQYDGYLLKFQRKHKKLGQEVAPEISAFICRTARRTRNYHVQARGNHISRVQCLSYQMHFVDILYLTLQNVFLRLF